MQYCYYLFIEKNIYYSYTSEILINSQKHTRGKCFAELSYYIEDYSLVSSLVILLLFFYYYYFEKA